MVGELSAQVRPPELPVRCSGGARRGGCTADRPKARHAVPTVPPMPRGKRRRRAAALVVAGLLVATGVAQTQPQQGQVPSPRQKVDPSDYLPPGSAKALVAKQCTACHDLDGTIRLRRTKADWEALVIDMVARGAPLAIEEVDAIVAYLAEVFSPTSPPLVDVNTATKEDLLKLPGVTEEAAERLIARRTSGGAFASRDEVRELLGLDASTFERIKWYLRPAGKRTN